MERLEEKIDKIVEYQGVIKADLQEHMRRTTIAEENIVQISNAIQPIQAHVAFVRGLGKLIGLLGTLLGGLAALWQVIFNK